jgi:hypothetical protein
MKNQIDDLSDLLNKQVTRSEFLKSLGIGIAAIVGLGRLIQLLGGNPQQQATGKQSKGYGLSGYGR